MFMMSGPLYKLFQFSLVYSKFVKYWFRNEGLPDTDAKDIVPNLAEIVNVKFSLSNINCHNLLSLVENKHHGLSKMKCSDFVLQDND